MNRGCLHFFSATGLISAEPIVSVPRAVLTRAETPKSQTKISQSWFASWIFLVYVSPLAKSETGESEHLKPVRRRAVPLLSYRGGLNYCGECYNRATSRMTFSEKLEDFYETFAKGRIGSLWGRAP
jgi:hypothetical protein